jgi:hypothetical protein
MSEYQLPASHSWTIWNDQLSIGNVVVRVALSAVVRAT